MDYLIQAAFLPPALRTVAADYLDAIRSVAPPLRTKNLTPLMDPLVNNYGYPNGVWAYENTSAYAIYGQHVSKVLARAESVEVAYRAASRQIDALERQGPAIVAAEATALAEAKRYLATAEGTATAITYPAPPRSLVGTGTAPGDARNLVSVRASGEVALSAPGGSIQGSEDNCMFCGSTFTASRGSVVCRLVSVVLPKGGALANFPSGKIGLIATDSLSSQAASVGVCFSNNRGLHSFSRPLNALSLTDQRAGSSPGLLAQSAVQVTSTPPAGQNWVLKPIWLKLQLEINTWTAYTSVDGATWTEAGAPMAAEFAGAWVGVFAASGKTGQTVLAVFDHITGFRTSTAVTIGSY